MTLLKAISLHMFQNKIKIYPPVLAGRLAEHLQILKEIALFKIIGALVTMIHNRELYWTVRNGLCRRAR